MSLYIFPLILLCLMVCVYNILQQVRVEKLKGSLGGAIDTYFGSLEGLVERISEGTVVL